MELSLSMKNICKLIRDKNFVFGILTVSQILAVIIICFVYGIFTSYQVSKEELNINSYNLNVYFTDEEEETVGDLRESMPRILEQIQDVKPHFIPGDFLRIFRTKLSAIKCSKDRDSRLNQRKPQVSVALIQPNVCEIRLN